MSSSDLSALSARISRLETLLGASKHAPCIHRATQTALHQISKRVPSELAGAHEIVRSLSNLTSAGATLRALDDVDGLLSALGDLETALPCLAAPRTSQIDHRALAVLQMRAARLAAVVRREERRVDELVVLHNEHVAAVNGALGALAGAVQTLGAESVGRSALAS